MAAKKKEQDFRSRYPGAKKIEGGGDWMEWAEVGQDCVGTYKGTESFRNGFKTTMITEDGVVVFSTPKLLKALLDGVEIGDRIAIVFTGEGKDTGKGNPLKEFEVYVLPAEG